MKQMLLTGVVEMATSQKAQSSAKRRQLFKRKGEWEKEAKLLQISKPII